jgi:hypothetical protein
MGQIHQHSTCSFYVRKLRAQLFCLRFRFVLYWRKPTGAKAVRKMLMKLSPSVYNGHYFWVQRVVVVYRFDCICKCILSKSN